MSDAVLSTSQALRRLRDGPSDDDDGSGSEDSDVDAEGTAVTL